MGLFDEINARFSENLQRHGHSLADPDAGDASARDHPAVSSGPSRISISRRMRASGSGSDWFMASR